MTPAPTEEPVRVAAPVEPVASTSVDTPAVAVDEPPVAAPPETVTAPTATAPVLREVPAPTPPPVASAAPTVPAPQAAPAAAAPPVAAPTTVAPLDFAALGTRLRETKTIGVLTKISVKNQADDLLDSFRAYHKRQGTATLSELRRSYDMLLLKVLSLLQDGDPPLARDIVESRTAIWDILADPRKFTESNLMAGVTP